MSSSSTPATPSTASLPHDFHAQLLPALRKEDGFLAAQEIIPYYGLFIGGNIVTRSPSIVQTYSGILSVNGEVPYILNNYNTNNKNKRTTSDSTGTRSAIGTISTSPSPFTTSTAPLLDQILVLALDDHTSQSIFPYLRLTYEYIQHHRLRYWYSHPTKDSELSSGSSSTYTLPSSSCTGGVFVHCTLGISRSATIVIAYIMMHSRLPVSIACKIVQRARPWIRPNDGFLYQLYHLEYLLGLSTLLPVHPHSPAATDTQESESSRETDTRYWPRTLTEVWNYPYPQNTYGHMYIYIQKNILHTYRFHSSFQFSHPPTDSTPTNTPTTRTTRTIDPGSSIDPSSSSSSSFFFTTPFTYKPYHPDCSLCTLATVTPWYGIDWCTFQQTYVNPFLYSSTTTTTIFQLPLSFSTVPKPFSYTYTLTNHPMFVILDCDSCHVPMIVLRCHLPNWKDSRITSIIYQDMQRCLLTYAKLNHPLITGTDDSKSRKESQERSPSSTSVPWQHSYTFIDEQQRTLPDHAHAHLRRYPVPAESLLFVSHSSSSLAKSSLTGLTVPKL